MMQTVYRAFNKRISGYGALFCFLTAGLLVSFNVKAQDFARKITWSAQPQSFTLVGNITLTLPTFTGAAHFQQYNMLPVYRELLPVGADGTVSAQIVNPVYEPAGAIDKSCLTYISNTLQPTAEMAYYRKTPRASVYFLPFRKNPSTGAVERLVSFTIRLKVTPKMQLRATNGYAGASVLASGTWYKLEVSADGIYKIDYNFLKKTIGIDPASVSLNKLAVFGNGGGMVPDQNSVARPDDLTENPTMVVDNNGNNKFDDGDYLLFYGQMPDAWSYNSTTGRYSHQKNLYSDKTYYFLTTDAGTGKRVPVSSAGGSANVTVTDFDDHVFHETDKYNLLQSGREWLGEQMTSFSNTQNFSFSFPNIETGTPIYFASALGINSTYSSTTTTSLNGQQVVSRYDGGISPNEYQYAYDSYTDTVDYNAGSAQINVAYRFNVSADPSGTASSYINWFELQVKRKLSLSGDAMTFRNAASVGTGKVSNFILSGASGNTQVWDVTSLGSITQMQGNLNGSDFSFTTATDQLKEFIAFNTNGSFDNPGYDGTVANQNLHGINQATLVIVTADDFVSSSNDLAAFHRSNDNITVTVALVSQIYNEFGSGKPDISAIRDFVKMLYDRAGGDTSKMPRYVLLMGDGSYDPKGRIANSNNYVTAYESYNSYNPLSSYTSDDFFGLLDANEGGVIENGTQLMDVAVGRLPVESESEAADMVTKIKNYKKLNAGCTTCVQTATNNSWRNIVTMVADYLYNGGVSFETNSDTLAKRAQRSYPQYNYNKIYTDAYKIVTTPAGDRFPDVNAAIQNRINAGTLLINWVGHGSEVSWSNARIFNYSDAVQLQNQYYPLFITATCDFSRYDLPDRTAGEELVVNGKGGGIGCITTVRLVYEYANQAINQAIFNYIFAEYAGRYPTMGEVTMLSKNAALTDQINTRKFTLLGDPALELDYPRYHVATTYVNDKPISGAQDTLKALTQVTIKGEIRDDNNAKMTGFSGTVYPVIYDKISNITTLNNNNYDQTYTFQMYKNILFKGKASVTNGEFSFTFIVPRDINYQFGNGRISYYADNGNNQDANGYSNDILIGGSSDTAHISTTGPKVDLYMDDLKFVFGGTTNTSPMLLVELQDAGGINTAGNGVGHDLTATLDGDAQNPIVLNDYYQSALNDYTKGEIRYPFSTLSEGRHTLKVKAWDIYNNSTEAYTEFVVTNNTKLSLNHVYNYPNPFTTHTEFMFEHNMPCDVFNVSVQIYSVSGKLVKSIVEQVQSTGYRVDGIEWDGLDDYGSPIGKGVYVYKLSVRDQNGLTAHKFEKLVVLR
ncbi:MAG TPA: type IX secretion system sortase PorU [Chitinophagales bacterium]|nr:type IX secretion system sortase PorU [Chitinophagales bacterium]